MQDIIPEADTAPKTTALHDLHVELGGKLVDFAGWSLPVHFAGIMAEHRHCRTKAGLFDVSHMGQVLIHGDGAAAAFERLVPGSIAGLASGRARYTVFTSETGGILDDLIVSRLEDGLFVVINASRRDADVAHMRAHLEPAFKVVELKEQSLLALQGPAAIDVLRRLCPAADDLTFMQTTTATIGNVSVRVSRLGYTGEDGFEISVAGSAAPALARRLLEDERVLPIGLGARDSLRLEAGLCLYGQDLTTETTPIEAGLAWAISKRRRQEGGFPGADIILRQLANGPTRTLVGLRPAGRAPARAGTEIRSRDGQAIGHVTSGGFGPSVDAPISIGYVLTDFAQPGRLLTLIIRGKLHDAEVTALPFLPHRYHR